MKFTKEHTMQMKGIAIIILLFHHCFLNTQRWATVPYEKLATTKGWGYYPISFAPFSSHTIQYLASFSKICVAMFVFMTGYGMWVSYESQKKKTTMSNYIKKRMVTLMTGFWIIFVVTEILAIPTGRFIEVYGHDFRSVVYMIIDALGLAKLLGTPLFCLTWWYMSLAIVLIMIFPFVHSIMEKYQWVVVVASIIVPRACGFGQSTDLFRYLLAYTLGMYFAQHDLLARIKEKFMEQNVAGKLLSLIVSLIGLAVIIKCRQNAWIGWKYLDFWDGFVAMYVIIISYIYILNGKWIVKGLGFLGKHSMNIFLIHSFYRDVFFHEFTYSFYYAWLDYIVLMAISLVTSIVLEWFKKLIRYEKFIEWVKRLVTKEGVTVH
ncbi:Predicted membrane protein [Anaerostipes hadrus]|uniref:Predicted membrane protein n=1 Tax=Anaerostipes hadrus TaxID=649756 RepID=A0A174J1P2_ANAHA|nr:acyltransferase family protein [Anaerostipes hadrus]CUO91030.1 Predicted membrane protein [Anaerostipes hadrus]